MSNGGPRPVGVWPGRDRPRRRRPADHGRRPGVGDVGRVRHRALPGHQSRVRAGGAGDAPVPQGGLQIPAELDGIVLAVLGLDNRPQAARTSGWPTAAATTSLHAGHRWPELYQFPAGTDGTGQTIAIIELGGGFSANRPGQLLLRTGHHRALGDAPWASTAPATSPARTRTGPTAKCCSTSRSPARSPRARPSSVYFAPNTDQGFVDAVSDRGARDADPGRGQHQLGPVRGLVDGAGQDRARPAIADGAALGVTVRVAAGDNGSGDGVSRRPAARRLPRVQPARAGLRRHQPAGDRPPARSGPRRSGTTAGGGATGGGVSDTFDLPAWQADAGVPASAGGGPAAACRTSPGTPTRPPATRCCRRPAGA